MAVKALKSVYNHATNTIIRDLSYELEKRLIDGGFATYDITGGIEAHNRTLSKKRTKAEENTYLLSPFAATSVNLLSSESITANGDAIIALKSIVSTDEEREQAVAQLQSQLGTKISQSTYDAMLAGNATDAELQLVQDAVDAISVPTGSVRTIDDNGAYLVNTNITTGVDGHMWHVPEGFAPSFLWSNVSDAAFIFSDYTAGLVTREETGNNQKIKINGPSWFTHTRDGGYHKVSIYGGKAQSTPQNEIRNTNVFMSGSTWIDLPGNLQLHKGAGADDRPYIRFTNNRQRLLYIDSWYQIDDSTNFIGWAATQRFLHDTGTLDIRGSGYNLGPNYIQYVTIEDRATCDFWSIKYIVAANDHDATLSYLYRPGVDPL